MQWEKIRQTGMHGFARLLRIAQGQPPSVIGAADNASPEAQESAGRSGESWRIVAGSVCGATHTRLGLPNQDAVAWRTAAGATLPVVVAVADGHGSPRCFRSDAGARLAVDVAIRMMEEFAGSYLPESLPPDCQEAARKLPELMVRAWREAVVDAIRLQAFSSGELDALESRAGSSARRSVEDNPLLVYGATLLTVLVAPGFVLFLQLGDGEILTVDDDGNVTRPLPRDERLLGNETTSLCLDQAWLDARLVLRAATIPPALILLSTDGYANSFANDGQFLQIGPDLLGIVRSEGLDYVDDNLQAWLDETTRGGSGDDITLAIVCRPDVGAARPPAPPAA